LTAFYAVLNGAVIGIGALTQFLIANRFISSVGVTRGQLAGPLTFLFSFSAIGVALLSTGNQLGTVFFFTVLAGRAIQKVIRISIYRSSTDLIFNPIPSERRGRAKAFKEAVIEPTGALAGGLFLILSSYFEMGVLIVVSLAFAGVFLVLALRLKNLYLDTDWGVLDCLGAVTGIGDYDDVLANSEEIELDSGSCRVLTLDALISAKQAMDRPRDRETVLQLQAIRERAMTALIQGFIDKHIGSWTHSDIEKTFPRIANGMIRKVHSDLRKAGRIVCKGRGRGAKWMRLD
jgi:hypothetical protein